MRLLLPSPWPLLSLLLRRERVTAMADVVAGAEAVGAPVYVAGQASFDRIAGFPVHRGVLALAARRPPLDPIRLLAGAAAVVVVEGVNDHENLGSIFRNAAALGAGAVLLDPSCCDPLYRRSIRVSVGHVLNVPFARLRPWPAALAEVVAAGFTLVAMDPAAPGTVEAVQPGRRVALLVGAEGSGLSPGAAALATHRVRIPMAAGVDSLNVATAVAIGLHRLAVPPDFVE